MRLNHFAALPLSAYAHIMNDQQLLRYSRHIQLDEIGIDGQAKLLAAHALVNGAGGLGSPVAFYQDSAGIGAITLVDNDTVDLTNLQRQILHTSERVGQPKAQSGKQTLAAINPEVNLDTLVERAEGDRLSELVRQADVVLACSDNFATRPAVTRACVAHGVPLVSGAAVRFDGQISVFNRRDENSDHPCYACLFSPDQEFEEVQYATMVVFAPLVAIIGTMQAAEALKQICRIGHTLAGRLMLLDARGMGWTSIKVARNPACMVRGGRQ